MIYLARRRNLGRGLKIQGLGFPPFRVSGGLGLRVSGVNLSFRV